MPDTPRPNDLQPEETAVSDWLGSLPRAEAPATLRARILSARTVERAGPIGRGWHRWASAAAAAMVLATVGWVGLRGGERESATPRATTGSVIVEDEALGLMHSLETFDQVGFDQHSELIAHWGN